MKEHVEKESETSSGSWTRMRAPCRVEDECRAEKTVVGVAQQTAGFSGREISKLCIAMHHAMLLSPDRTLTPSLYCHVLEQKLLEHSQKLGFETVKGRDKDGEKGKESMEYVRK